MDTIDFMPTILAIETSTNACSVALLYQGVMQESFLIRPREHNQVLLPLVEELLNSFSLRVADLDAIAFGAGPGSFTGLRLSASVVQGMAYAADKPVIPVSSLAALAHSAALLHEPVEPSLWLVATDARMGDVYHGVYQVTDGRVTTLEADVLLPASGVLPAIARHEAGRKVGDGWHITSHNIAAVVDVYPRAQSVLAIAVASYKAGHTVPAELALPVYLRESITWQKWRPKGQSLKAD